MALPAHRLQLNVLTARLAVCRLDGAATIPTWADGPGFVSITRTGEELSVVCPEDRVPSDVRSERGYAAIGVEGPLAPDLVGVLVSLAMPLAEAGIPIFVVGTFDTDYLLVRDASLERAATVLRAAGHHFIMNPA